MSRKKTLVAKQKKSQPGWVDLCLTFSEAGLSVPPIPKPHRELLVKREEWFWSTRPDINAFKMYMFEYVTELFTGSVSDYSAISHAGHGINSYGLNVCIVTGPIGVIFQHAWGGVYSDPRRDLTDIAACFWEMRKLLRVVKAHPQEQRLAHVVAWSEFREKAEYYTRDSNEQWILLEDSEGRRPRVSYANKQQAYDDEPEIDIGAACRRFLADLSIEDPRHDRS